MYRRPKEIKYLKFKSKNHAVNHPERSKLSIEWKDIDSKGYQKIRWRCNCKSCKEGKLHKHKRSAPMNPLDYESWESLIYEDYDDEIWNSDEAYYDIRSPYGCNLEEAEEWSFCLPNEYEDDWSYNWLYGSEFKGDDGV